MWGNQFHPDDPRVNVNLCMRIQRSELNSVKSTSSVLSAEQTTKCIRPFRKPGPSKQTYLREADTSSVLFNKQTPQSEAIKSQQKETETIDQPGWSLPLSPDVSKGSETDEAVWTGNRLLCPPQSSVIIQRSLHSVCLWRQNSLNEGVFKSWNGLTLVWWWFSFGGQRPTFLGWRCSQRMSEPTLPLPCVYSQISNLRHEIGVGSWKTANLHKQIRAYEPREMLTRGISAPVLLLWCGSEVNLWPFWHQMS